MNDLKSTVIWNSTRRVRLTEPYSVNEGPNETPSYA